MRIKEAYLKAKGILKAKRIEEASLVTKIVLAHLLNCKKEELILYEEQELEEKTKQDFLVGIEKIANGYPVQYLTGKKEFMKMDFLVTEDVLIPRADTEILVEEAIKLSQDRKDILDLCTGTGVIAISLAKYGEALNMTATDISKKAIEIAKKNHQNLIAEKKINWILSDMFENIDGKFNMIVSNPPYIRRDVIEEYQLKDEPKLALDRWRGRTSVLPYHFRRGI